MKSFLQTAFYWLNARTWTWLALRIVTSRDIQGVENIPRSGPLIVTSNHFSVGDPPILTGVFPRRIVWMAKQELFDIPIFGLLYYMAGFIPVRRFEGDLRALRRSQDVLRRSMVLGMFPEGTRSGGRLGAGEPGSALVAMRTGSPILPVAIWGTEHARLPRDLFRRTRVSIRYGKPFKLPQGRKVTKAEVASGTAEIMRRIGELLPPRYVDSEDGSQSDHQTAAAEGRS